MTFCMIAQLWNTNTPAIVSCDADQTENYMYISMKFRTGVHVFCWGVGVFNRSPFWSVSYKDFHFKFNTNIQTSVPSTFSALVSNSRHLSLTGSLVTEAVEFWRIRDLLSSFWEFGASPESDSMDCSGEPFCDSLEGLSFSRFSLSFSGFELPPESVKQKLKHCISV